MVHTIDLCSHQKCMFDFVFDDSHHQKLFTPYSCNHTKRVLFTPKKVQFTPKLWRFISLIGLIHTRNKFIHTKIEYFILYGTNVTLNQVSSHSKLATWRHNMMPNTNDTHTHEETGTLSGSLRKTLLSLDVSRLLHKHDTCAPSSYTPPLLLSHPTRIPCESCVHKLASLKIRDMCGWLRTLNISPWYSDETWFLMFYPRLPGQWNYILCGYGSMCSDIFAAARLWRGCLLTTGHLSSRHHVVMGPGDVSWGSLCRDGWKRGRAVDTVLPSVYGFSAV